MDDECSLAMDHEPPPNGGLMNPYNEEQYVKERLSAAAQGKDGARGPNVPSEVKKVASSFEAC